MSYAAALNPAYYRVRTGGQWHLPEVWFDFKYYLARSNKWPNFNEEEYEANTKTGSKHPTSK